MTIPYDVEDKECEECGHEVEDYTGHWSASEVTLCEGCYRKYYDQYKYMADVVHSVPKV